MVGPLGPGVSLASLENQRKVREINKKLFKGLIIEKMIKQEVVHGPSAHNLGIKLKSTAPLRGVSGGVVV